MIEKEEKTPKEQLESYLEDLDKLPKKEEGEKVSRSSKRLEGESYEDYKKRQKLIKKATKKYLKGRIRWAPHFRLPIEGNYVAGPYVKEKHGELGSGANNAEDEDKKEEDN